MSIIKKTAKKATVIALAIMMVFTYFPALPGPITTAAANDPEALRLWYSSPADVISGVTEQNAWERWSLPIGNSSIGANVFGRVSLERISLNEKSLWSGGPTGSTGSRRYIDNSDPYDFTRFEGTDSGANQAYNGGNSLARGNWGAQLATTQNLFATGATTTQTNAACNNLIGLNNNGYGYFLSYGNMYINFGTTPAYTNYKRWLDLNTAIAGVEYDMDGVHYTRENFISFPDNVLVTRLTSTGGNMIPFTVSVESNTANSSPRTYTTEVTTVGSDRVIKLAGYLNDNNMLFQSTTRIVIDGSGAFTNTDTNVTVTGTSSVTIYTTIGTDYKDLYPKYRTGETSAQVDTRVTGYVTAAAAKGFNAVRQNHVADYSGLFSRINVDIGQEVSAYPTNQLITRYNSGAATFGEQRQLELLLFQYGRYLMIEGSREARPGEDVTLPTNLQGLWANVNNSSWHSDYHMNINLQMNYWPAYNTNLAECAMPVIDFVDKLREPGRITAAIYAGIYSTAENPENGFTAHTQNTPFGWTCPGWSFSWGYSPAAVPWILQNCWEYYEYTEDLQFLKDTIYPMMKEESKFYSQYLYKVVDANSKDGYYYISCPAYSPETGPYTMGNTYEQTLVWQHFTDTLTAAELVGETDNALIADWQEKRDHLYGPLEIGNSGQIKEWYIETTFNRDANGNTLSSEGYSHRHMSHLLGLYPLDLISFETPELLKAAIVSLNNRVDQSTGWAMGQRINAWARVGDGDHAHKLISNLLTLSSGSNGGILENLWDTHTPYQIDGNFAATSGFAEMLLQSNVGYINILPALPKAWPNGSYNGLVARGNFEIGVKWENMGATEVTVLSKNGNDAVVQYKGISEAAVTDKDGVSVSFTAVSDDRISFETTAGQTYIITGIPEQEPIIEPEPEIPPVYDTLIENGKIMASLSPNPLDSRISNHQGSNGGRKSDDGGTIVSANYNPLSIGWFFDDNQRVNQRIYMDGLDNQGGNWAGYLDLTVDADRESPYQLNILCFSGSSRRYEIIVNGQSCGATPFTHETPAYSVGGTGSNETRVLQKEVILKKGANTIRIQAPSGEAAPNFMGLAVAQRVNTKPRLTGSVNWLGSAFFSNPDVVINRASSATLSSRALGSMVAETYDPETIGWFFPDLEQPTVNTGVALGSKYSINGLDNAGSAEWNGSVVVRVVAPKTDLYNVNVLVERPDTAVGRLYEVTVNDVSQGNTLAISSSTIRYSNNTSYGGAVLQRPVKLNKGENFIKLQAPYGSNGPAFYAMAVVGYEAVPADVGQIMSLGDPAVEARNGSGGAWTNNSTTAFGLMRNFNPDTIGLFLPEDTSGITASYVTGLDSAATLNRGHLNLSVNAQEDGEYLLNIMCSTGTANLLYDVTVNGVSQGNTDAVSNSATSSSTYSTLTSQMVNVLQKKINLKAGENTIRLQSPSGVTASAPNFMAALVLGKGIINHRVVEEIVKTVQANSDAAGMLIVAAYNVQNRLIAIKPLVLEAGLKTYAFDLDIADAKTVRVFAWNENFVPLYKDYQIQQTD